MSDDRAQIRAQFPVPDDRDLPPGSHLQHRQNLMSQILTEHPNDRPTNEEPRRRQVRQVRRMRAWRSPAWPPSARVLLATAVAVALVAGLSVTAADRLSAHQAASPSAPTAARASATTTVVLDRIAQAAAAGPSVNVGPNQYFYVKAQVVSTSIFAKSGTVEGWIAQSAAKETLWRDNGQNTIQKAGTAFQGWTRAAADSKAAVCSGELRLIMTGSPWSASAAAWGLNGRLASLATCPQMLPVSGAGGNRGVV